MNKKDYEIDITEGHYNKTISEDGIRYIVDTSKEYPYCDVTLFKRYFDIEKSEVINPLINDLKELVNELEQYKAKKEAERDER